MNYYYINESKTFIPSEITYINMYISMDIEINTVMKENNCNKIIN